MLKIIYLLTIFLNLALVFKNKRNKYIEFMSVILIYVLIAGNTSSPDVQNYSNMYTLAPFLPWRIEFGYQILERIGNMIGLTYPYFRAVVSILPVFLLYKTAKELVHGKIHLFLIGYLLFPVFMDSVQIRIFIAFSIVLYALRFLLLPQKKWLLKYLFLIAVAATFHITSIVYTILLLVKLKKAKSTTILLIGFSLSICFLTYINHNNLIFSGVLDYFFKDEKIQEYLVGKTTNGFLTSFAMQALNILVSALMLIAIQSQGDRSSVSFKINQMLMWFNLIMILIFPFQMLSITFYRLYRNMLIPTLISTQISFNVSNFKYRVFILFCVFSLLTIWFYYDIFFLDNLFDSVWKTILDYNLFFQ
ncbi:EpsG family protein [Enterococcus faecium]|uniref:EpsG family protein n=1 Tax=Enterococcus faecium TaxID=1352 RepID=UPI0002A28123|nr:EpsG family protein [Enterococcus faecium]ELB05721.1 hypothetical protein OIG_04185 [Enterococcus faecium EnGen0028]EME3190076.1 EpsG family protein [Enterococcus faecium]EOF69686.1 hypothetical protein SEU_01335 [Enterococcus faecium EnGen0130]